MCAFRLPSSHCIALLDVAAAYARNIKERRATVARRDCPAKLLRVFPPLESYYMRCLIELTLLKNIPNGGHARYTYA